MLRIVHIHNTPRVSPASDGLAIDHDLFFRADNRKGQHGSKFRVLGNGLFVVFFDVVGKVVDGDVVVFNVFVDLDVSLGVFK